MRELLDSTDCVLFDFDGPVCRLFVRHRAADVAARLRALPALRTAAHPLTEPDDPYAVLRAGIGRTVGGDDGIGRDSAHGPEGGEVSAELTELLDALTAEELRAAESAWPTPYADQLLQTLHATDRRPAIVTDTSEEAVERYLVSRGLDRLFTGRVHGRGGSPRALKPDPAAVHRALASTGAAAERALLIGTCAREKETADAAGVRFVGYAPSEEGAAALRAAGAEHVVGSLLELVDAARVPHFS
ncbi:HAD hydrolase-like protein [Streptomyces sp. XM4193]|uniref:HAD family hydrolase n=1 Tax=Streptomyces sp. XM4193 TaxID=2929782 RepID=UPI001FF8C60D|nr:HAD hydrolase-like protein [Streptomyces sp. XM4193]MCK1798204.1 HAD hydrolase-like protein [Streptomyces sp. XM4193]